MKKKIININRLLVCWSFSCAIIAIRSSTNFKADISAKMKLVQNSYKVTFSLNFIERWKQLIESTLWPFLLMTIHRIQKQEVIFRSSIRSPSFCYLFDSLFDDINQQVIRSLDMSCFHLYVLQNWRGVIWTFFDFFIFVGHGPEVY